MWWACFQNTLQETLRHVWVDDFPLLVWWDIDMDSFFWRVSSHRIIWYDEHVFKHYQKPARWWFSNIFYFHPYLGKISILTNIFQRGWNHQPENQYPNPVGWQLVTIGSAVPPSLSPGRRCRRGHAGAARLAARRCWSSAATGGGPAIGVVVFSELQVRKISERSKKICKRGNI